MRFRDNTTSEILDAAHQSFRGRVVAPDFNTTSRLVGVTAFGHGGEQGASDEVLRPQEFTAVVPLLFPYGYAAMPPTSEDIEFHWSASGLVGVSCRSPLPTGVPNLASGDSVKFSSAGHYHHQDADGNTDDVVPSGKKHKIHAGGTVRDTAFAHTTEAGASQVASGTKLDDWTHDVKEDIKNTEADLDTIRTALNSTISALQALNSFVASKHGATGVIPPGTIGPLLLVPDTTDGINKDTNHSYVSTGSGVSQVQDDQ
jgi:hypothetical protein